MSATFEFIGGHIDRSKLRRMNKATEGRMMRKFGAFVMTTAKISIRRPGRRKMGPPVGHTRTLEKNIRFDYSSAVSSVVIGSIKLSGKTDAPRVLEHGGRGRFQVKGRNRGTRVFKKRAYMVPAFQKELSELPRIWKESVK